LQGDITQTFEICFLCWFKRKKYNN